MADKVRAVLFGMDTSGTTAGRPTNPPHGFMYYDEDLGTIVVYDKDLDDWKVMQTS